jgi:hypothetical protein
MGTVSTVTIGTDTVSVYNLDDGDTPAENLASFWNVRLGDVATAVAAASTDDLNRSLVIASDWLDRAITFSGTKTVEGQDRAWPRDGATCDGTAITDGTTPGELAFAAFWLAGQLLVDPTLAESAGQGSNVKKVGAGSASVEFFTPTIGSGRDIPIPRVAFDYVKCLQGGSTSNAGGVASGTDSCSSFSEDGFERSDGFA